MDRRTRERSGIPMERQNNAKWLRGRVGPFRFVSGGGSRDDLSEYCGGDHHGQIDRVHDVIFMMMMMMTMMMMMMVMMMICVG